MDPCGTPVDSCNTVDFELRNSTNCLFGRYVLIILTNFPESHSNIIYPTISHDLRYRKPSIGRGRYLRGYYLYP